MQTVTQQKLETKILKTSSPVLAQRAWQIESFCAKTFEYADYSLRKALAGSLDGRLKCTFFTVQNSGSILAAAGCLCSADNPAVAILGPVCTETQHREKGMALQICQMLLEHLKVQKIQAVYLGVRNNTAAVKLYKKLGFIQHAGIVMRKLFVNENEFNKRYSPGQQTVVGKLDWRDFAEVSALFCESAKIFSFDFCEQVFSSRYTEVQKFLPVFPSLMNRLKKNGGFGLVLQTKEYSSIVGTAFVNAQPSKTQNHIAILEFFVLDGFTEKAIELVSETIKQSGFNGSRTILCYCPECDIYKKQILLSLGAEPYAALPGFVRINNKFRNTVIYKLTRKL
ncbi:MAG: GNAT family N-acetyltransferase [Planctomycetota bacterium]|jgi:hypothetical protein